MKGLAARTTSCTTRRPTRKNCATPLSERRAAARRRSCCGHPRRGVLRQPHGRALALLTVAPAFLSACCRLQGAQTPPGAHFSVLTYNVNREMPDPDATVRLIRERGADVVVLQEITEAWEGKLREALGEAYPHMLFRQYRRGGGLAILARSPVREAAYIESPAGKYPGWIVEADTPVGPVTVLAVHLHPPVDAQARFTLAALRWRPADRRREIEAYMRQLPADRPAVIVGDFNEARSGSAVRFAVDHGFIDALSRFDRCSPTWTTWLLILPISNRIDHVLYRAPLHCYEAMVAGGGGSDHRAVYAVLGRESAE